MKNTVNNTRSEFKSVNGRATMLASKLRSTFSSTIICIAATVLTLQSGGATVFPSAQSNTGVRFLASWHQSIGSEVLLNPAMLQLPVQLENQESRDIVISVGIRTEEDGIVKQPPPSEVTLSAYEKRTIQIALQLSTAVNLQFSGKLIAEASARMVVGRETGSTVLPHLYFHPAEGGLRFYREGILRSKYGAGNFRRLPLDTGSGYREFQRAAVVAGLPATVQATVARMSQPRVTGNPEPSPGNGRRFCLAMPGEAYNDSSDRVWTGPTGGLVSKDYGEDYGRGGQLVPMTRAWVSVTQGAGPLYGGFLDAAGCTPYVPAAANVPTLIALSPLYLHTTYNIRGFVSDANLTNGMANQMPLFFLYFQSANSQTMNVLCNSLEYAQTIFAAAAQGMERFRGGSTNELYEWRIRVADDPANLGTGTDYAPEGHPRVEIKFSTAAQSKFTVVHEYGHAVLMARLNPPLAQSDLDYSVVAPETQQHLMRSNEWQLVAAIEGFAHFVAGVAWNDTAINADAIYVDGSNVNPNLNAPYDLATFERYFETNWDAASNVGQGVETDWAQFFWNYHTDAPLIAGVLAPTQATLVTIFLNAYPWTKHEGFFEDFASAAQGLLPATAIIPPSLLPYQWFSTVASAAGIVH